MPHSLRIFPAPAPPDNGREAYVGGRTIRPGDLVGFSACDLSGVLINLGSCGVPFVGLSHVAIAAPDHPNTRRRTRLLLFESTSLSHYPCAIQNEMIDGVQAHPIARRCSEYRGRVYHFRLVRPLDARETSVLAIKAYHALGRPYDWLGAFRARDLPIGKIRSRLFGRPELASLFCSEMVASFWDSLSRGVFVNPSAWSPNRLARHAVRTEITYPGRRLRWPPRGGLLRGLG